MNAWAGGTWVLACVGVFLTGGASACTGNNGIADSVVETLSLPNEMRPGIELTGWRGNLYGSAAFTGCSHGQRLNVFLVAAMSGLTYVGPVTVGGESHHGYQFSPTSPLIALRVRPYAAANSNTPLALRYENPLSFYGNADRTSIGNNNDLQVTIQYAIVSRGGPMTSVTAHTPMSARTDLRSHPGAGTLTHSMQFVLNVPTVACTLSNATLTLPDAQTTDLANPGDNAQARPLNVSMNCPSAGIPVTLELADANGSSGVDGALMPGSGSTASGVQLQLLRNNVPVPFRRSWSHGSSVAGNQNIAFSARYLRTADALKPGEIRGQATLTATYR